MLPNLMKREFTEADKNASPRISVLMLTFNRPQFIGRAIQSVLNQTYQDWELIVVQDGNHKLTADIL